MMISTMFKYKKSERIVCSYPDSCVSPPTSVEAVASIECTPGITVSWTKPSAQPEPDEYKVTCTDGSTPVEKTVVASEQPTTTLTTGIQPSVAYSCQVVSVKGSEESSPASATPPEVTYRYVLIPSNLSLVLLSWDWIQRPY